MTDDRNPNSNNSTDFNEADAQAMRSLIVPELSAGKLFFLGALAFLFASLEPFALFASIPFTLSFLLYGKMKTFFMGVIGTALAFGLVQLKAYQGSALGTFPLSLIYGFLISNSLKRKEHPVRGIAINGISVFMVFMALILAFHFNYEGGVEGLLVPYVKTTATQYYKNIETAVGVPGEQLRQLKDVMDNPMLIVSPIVNYGTGFIFVGVLLSFWVGTFVALRMAPLWTPFHEYSYDSKSLTSFQVPYFTIWPLIAGLVLAVGSSYGVFGEKAEVYGFNILLMLGIFYFFQGFGILSELLTHWRFFGFFRSMVIFFAVITSYQIIALVGVLDTWVNFRRFFENKNDEGDTL